MTKMETKEVLEDIVSRIHDIEEILYAMYDVDDVCADETAWNIAGGISGLASLFEENYLARIGKKLELSSGDFMATDTVPMLMIVDR